MHTRRRAANQTMRSRVAGSRALQVYMSKATKVFNDVVPCVVPRCRTDEGIYILRFVNQMEYSRGWEPASLRLKGVRVENKFIDQVPTVLSFTFKLWALQGLMAYIRKVHRDGNHFECRLCAFFFVALGVLSMVTERL